ncbi:MAG: replication-associated recombination protein A [Candidatus Zixiibacteriota bacterium]
MDLFTRKSADGLSADRAALKPLADRMRPNSFDEFVGQIKIVGPGQPLREAIERDAVGSLIFWGPPGTGKTTLAELIAKSTHGQFVRFPAVTSSIKEVKQVISKAGNYYEMSGRRTYVFVDEIHRFNKAQQDAFLPYVESGEVVLIGATTENPSFEVISALLSRMRVYVLERLLPDDLAKLVRRALSENTLGLGAMHLSVDDDFVAALVEIADGDGRRALSLLESVADFSGSDSTLTFEQLQQVVQERMLVYDKTGEEHYNLISALHKTIRGGDPDAALYWLARMLAGGEEPMYIIRRLVRFATEDIGLADPYALTLTVNARDAFHFLGSPEGELAIAQAVIYMACAPKSNSVYIAFSKAQEDASEHGSLPVPLCIRNAPTKLMKSLGYGKDYQYAHEYEGGITDQEYFPDKLAGSRYYHPRQVGRETRLAEYIEMFREHRSKLMSSTEKKKP